jgi:hypothetical protein
MTYLKSPAQDITFEYPYVRVSVCFFTKQRQHLQCDISGTPSLIHAKLCTDTYFYMTYNSSLVSHLIRATLFFEQSRIF